MRIDIISAVPKLLESPFNHSIIQRAKNKGLVEIHVHDLRDFAVNNYGKIDDAPYGGGAGMVLMIEPIDKCITKLQSERKYDQIIYMAPDAPVLNQSVANKLSLTKNLILLCGHYKGIDQRVRDLFITKEISLGNYVLSGGELAAAVLCDSIIRLIPGVLNDETAALSDSFQDNLLAPPLYTRPANYKNAQVPEVLLSGDFKKIDQWRSKQAIALTKKLKPELLD
ncbi:MAG: tRNA (guanosine(37)-N1)-methyltransferase TrmD [Flavobacteriales bacterium]|nr:MAG: tRNA (guanosine(37)-N1)-methyltransferase TrmD [Flavobacteriales bacterium]